MALKLNSPQNKHSKKISLDPLPHNPQLKNLTEHSPHGFSGSPRKDSLPMKADDKAFMIPTIISPKKPTSKFALGNLIKPLNTENVGISAPLKPMGETGTIMSAKDRTAYTDFMTNLYKTPSSNSNAFMSFREIASNKAQGKMAREMDEIFRPSDETNWKAHLDFNKRQEGMFKQTIHDVFKETQGNFNKLLRDKEKKNFVMPHIKVYQNAQDIKNESKPSTPEKESQQQQETIVNRNYQQPGSKLHEYASRLRVTKGQSYKFFEYPTGDSSLHLPSAREGATLTVVGNNIYLYGGLSREVHNEMEVLNAVSFTWKRIVQRGDIPSWGRFGHSADYYQNSLIIFGGEKHYNTTLKIRECLSDVRLFVPETNEWKYQKCHGELIEPRRNHTGTVVGRHMVIYGGIDSNGNYLNDLKVLDLGTNRWGSVEDTGRDIRGIAFHKACAVLLPTRKDVNLFKLPEIKTDELGPKIVEEGIYFFGGKTEMDETINTLRILKIGSLPFKWITPKTEGIPPDPRFSHTMVYCKKLNSIVVHGGRADSIHPKNGLPYLADYWILQLENFTWFSVVLKNALPSPRCSHAAAVVGSKMLIFGGIYFGNYCPPEPKVIQMDQMQVYKLENNKRESINRSVDFNIPQQQDQIMMTAANHNQNQSLNMLTSIKSYNNVVTFLPMPQLNRTRTLKKVSKPSMNK